MSWKSLLATFYSSVTIWTCMTETVAVPAYSIQLIPNAKAYQLLLNLQTTKEDSATKPSLLPYLVFVIIIVVLTAICIRVVSYLAKLRDRNIKNRSQKISFGEPQILVVTRIMNRD